MEYSEFILNHPDGCEFFCRKWIPDNNPKGIVVLAHGLSDHGDRFIHVAKAFVDARFIFVAPDLRGNGRTSGKRGHFDSMEQILNDFKFLINKTVNDHPRLPLLLYGQSMGGNIVINYALQNPAGLTAVISSSPWLQLTKPPVKAIVSVAAAIRRLSPSLLIGNGINSRNLCCDEAIQHAYDTDPLIHWKVSLATFFAINSGGEWAIRNASQLQVPLLLMHGTSDQITSYKASSEFARNAGRSCDFKTWEGCRHELHNEPEKEAVIQIMLEWAANKLLPEKPLPPHR